jgi:fluoride exporter
MNGWQWIAVFLGGGLGSLARLGMSKWIGPTSNGFPLHTLITNLIACLVLGFAVGVISNRPGFHPVLKMGITTGFCGGFSTFSAFSLESVDLLSNGKFTVSAGYVIISVSLCFTGIWLGQVMGRRIGG